LAGGTLQVPGGTHYTLRSDRTCPMYAGRFFPEVIIKAMGTTGVQSNAGWIDSGSNMLIDWPMT